MRPKAQSVAAEAHGAVVEVANPADCKSVALGLRRFESCPLQAFQFKRKEELWKRNLWHRRALPSRW